jgi:hypothetical protein
MKGVFRRALCAVAGSLAFASAAHAVAPASMANPSLMSTTAASGLSGAVDISQPFALPNNAYGPPASDRLAVTNVATSISLITGLDLELGYKVELNGRIAPIDASDAHTFDGLFLSSAASGSPYTSLAGGGGFLGAATALADDLHVNVGMANLSGTTSYAPDAYTALARMGGDPSAYDARDANSLFAGVSWDFAKWAGLGFLASHSNERGAVLGYTAPSMTADTSALGVQAHVRFGGGWSTTASYSEGLTRLDMKPGLAAALSGDAFRTRSYGIAIAKNGLFGDDTLGLAVSRPALGSDSFTTTAAGPGQPLYFTRDHLLGGAAAPETDVEIGYVTTFLDGSVALQTNAAYQMNFGGQTGTNAVSLLSRARIKF